MHRRFRPDGPDRLWVQDVTQHRTGEGWVYLAVVIDAWSRRVVGSSIADPMRAELVADAIDMATSQISTIIRAPFSFQRTARGERGGSVRSRRQA